MRTTIEPIDLDADLPLLHTWVTHPRSVFWEMQDATVADVASEYRLIEENPHHHAWLGRVDGAPAFLAETYDPLHSELAGLPELRPGDLGMHVLVAPTDSPVHGFTRQVFAAVLAHCFADPAVRRVVVEPDARNERIRALNREFGFRELRTITLPTKEATLSVLESDHLTPENLAAAQRHLVTKAISEYAHERLLTPVADGDTWLVTTPAGDTTYTFTAERLALDHWAVDAASVVRTLKDEPADLDVQELVAELAEVLGIPDALLPTYLEELAATLASTCWKLQHSTVTAEDLLSADYQAIEAAMTEGHPGFVANNGRVGFGADDYAAYAPETGSTVRLHWLAARREHTRLSLGEGMATPYDERVLVDHGLDPQEYVLIPVHPWQWHNKIAITFAPDLARRDLVHLGEGPDDYRAQQSIRTFFNTTDPTAPYVKTALSIQNMGFMRGLSPRYMAATPAINDWVHALVAADPTLQALGFTVLRERAAVGYTGDAYHRLAGRSAYQKMIAALWRESPVPALADGERLATMAALLHRDAGGRSLAAAMIESSTLDARAWVRCYLDAYLLPVAHCLLAHDLAFMPHGENLVLVLRDQVPVRAVMKDIGEEVAVMSLDRDLPDDVERIRVDVEPDVKALALHTDVFDGVLRHLAAILHVDGVLDEGEFWAEVAGRLRRHAADHPELADAAAAYDFFRPTFRHSCLNRLQLRNTLEMVDIADQSQSLIYAGTLDNPIA
ncbi:siderophore synthetase [Nocardioides sp. Root1257]|uniref:GNAT family N-acetyltransferase n=1 Tax=unclassified Nocardioides TaxID=2615069 RepID=UPI0006F81401|nr:MULTISPECIES: GNAT family N-acetyltransferase [unclassified Nocardioides]KQW53600.1 siderophore synthetase [Nocardioides sp. Root1257]KRC56286.1 siderophore synthetase [Nocardioides sp. Root224]